MYTIDLNGVVKRNADSYIVPKDVNSLAYQNYLYWQANGILENTPFNASPTQINTAIVTNDTTL